MNNELTNETAAELDIMTLTTEAECIAAIAQYPAQVAEIAKRITQLARIAAHAAKSAPKTTAEWLRGTPGDGGAYIAVLIGNVLADETAADYAATYAAIVAAFGGVQTAQGSLRQRTQSFRSFREITGQPLPAIVNPELLARYEDVREKLDDIARFRDFFRVKFAACAANKIDNPYPVSGNGAEKTANEDSQYYAVLKDLEAFESAYPGRVERRDGIAREDAE